MTQLIDEMVACVQAPNVFTPFSFTPQITKNIEQFRSFVNEATAMYHIADEVDRVFQDFVPAKRAFETLQKAHPVFRDMRDGEIELPFGMELQEQQEEYLTVVTQTQEVQVPSQQWAGYYEDVLHCQQTALPDFVIKAIFANNMKELKQNLETLKTKEVMKQKVIQFCKENKLHWILAEMKK